MSRATPKMRNLAERLIAYEAMQSKSANTIIPFTFPVIEKLQPQLATLMGNVGFHALLSRALALANADVPWLRAVHVADGYFKMSDVHGEKIKPSEYLEGRVALLAQLLGLLVAFIGVDLTLRLVSEVWPKVSLHKFNFDKGA